MYRGFFYDRSGPTLSDMNMSSNVLNESMNVTIVTTMFIAMLGSTSMSLCLLIRFVVRLSPPPLPTLAFSCLVSTVGSSRQWARCTLM